MPTRKIKDAHAATAKSRRGPRPKKITVRLPSPDREACARLARLLVERATVNVLARLAAGDLRLDPSDEILLEDNLKAPHPPSANDGCG